MATYRLPFGYMDWPVSDEAPDAGPDVSELQRGRTARLLLRLPAALKQRIEATAALEGVPPDTWIERALARSVDPRLDTLS